MCYHNAINPGLAVLGLGLAVASAIVVYKNRRLNYGWAGAGAAVNILALLLTLWGGTLFHGGQPYATRPATNRGPDKAMPFDKGFGPGDEKVLTKDFPDKDGKMDKEK